MPMMYRCPACDAPSGSCGESECAMLLMDNPYGMCGDDVGCEFDGRSQGTTAPVYAVPEPTRKINISSGEDVVLC